MAEPRKRRRLSADGSFQTNGGTEVPSPDVPGAKTTAQKTSARNTLFVRSLAVTVTTETLTEHFSQSHPLKHATVVLDKQTKQSRGYGFVTFVDPEDAQQAATELDNTLLEGRKIKVEVAEPRHRDVQEAAGGTSVKSVPSAEAARLKAERESKKTQGVPPPKLIVRNLPWSVKDSEQLAHLFRSYGKVKHADIPKKNPRVQSGFGFVVMRGRKNAERAIEGVNGKEVDGRTLAVDWAVEKSVWEELQKGQEDEELPAAAADQVEDEEADDGEAGVSLQEDDATSESGSEDSEPLSAGSDEDFDIDVDAHDTDDLESTKPTDREEATLFIRNVPFTATDDSLDDHFSQFGPLRYARVVLDPETERPRGTGFVCFRNSKDAIACLRQAPKTRPPAKAADTTAMKHSILENEAADPSGQYTMDGRVLQVALAVTKNEAARLEDANTTQRNSRDRDKRRLFLLSEGTIPRDSPLYEKLSPSEIQMREASAKQRQSFIKNNPSLHISLTRLSIRNIPRNITSKDLKALAREAVVGFATDVKAGLREPLSKEELRRSNLASKEAEYERKVKGVGIVKQAKIVFESEKGSKVAEKTGAGRSRGYGFIEYVSHRSALMGLRWLNGHAVKAASKEEAKERKKRLIVEFAIENAVVVGRRSEREGRAKEYPKRQAKESANGLDAHTTELSSNQRSKLWKKGEKKRKREKSDTGTAPPTKRGKPTKSKGSGEKPSQSAEKDPVDFNKVAKRNRIIAKKRMARKGRKAG